MLGDAARRSQVTTVRKTDCAFNEHKVNVPWPASSLQEWKQSLPKSVGPDTTMGTAADPVHDQDFKHRDT
ncbi:hypothetical protein E4U40_007527 [Claviceps sp. LM458 group G5]|nr:hypothetical protein E4U40_007527 [Claviceps sp. LM458 group G5]